MYDEEQPKKKKRFKLFDSQREGKGVTKEQANLPPNLKKFFIIYRRDFSRLLSVNLFIVLGNFPVFFLLIALSGILSVDFATPAVGSFPAFSGLLAHTGTTAPMLALNGIIGPQATGGTYLPIAYVFFGLSLLTFFTFGLVHVGTTYVLRNMVSRRRYLQYVGHIAYLVKTAAVGIVAVGRGIGLDRLHRGIHAHVLVVGGIALGINSTGQTVFFEIVFGVVHLSSFLSRFL